MDELQIWEAKELLKQIPYTNRDLKEFIRMNSFILAQVNSKKKLKVSDVVPLPFDNLYKDTEIKKEDIDRMKNAVSMFQKKMK